jgi:hypothetical protein
MLLLATVLLSSTSWLADPSCPPAFSSLNTTIGAISDSTQLNLCVSKAIFVKGTNGSLTLILGSGSSNAPRCLVYPNGLSLDLTFSLLSSGHVGCWSLYPPNQTVSIVNVGRPSQSMLYSAMKSFRPQTPLIFVKPAKNIKVGTKVILYSSAKSEVLNTKLLSLPAQIRFRPIKYRWRISQGGLKAVSSVLAKTTFVPTIKGDGLASLAVTYSIEYSFTGLTSWSSVQPNILLNASPNRFSVVSEEVPKRAKEPPRLVNRPCSSGSTAWRC